MSPELTSSDLQTILLFTVALARTAGALILEGSEVIQSASSKESDIVEKNCPVDLVTEYDVKVEELVKREIKAAFPEFKFIGEESSFAGARAPLTDEPTFCVDPIDGTTNFVHGFPYVCISLGLIYKRKPVLGVIYNPFLDHLYTGIKGQGSYLTRHSGKALRLPLSSSPKPLPSLSQALIMVQWGTDRNISTLTGKASSFLRLAGNPAQGVTNGKMAHSLRSVGSTALTFATVAQGGIDIAWEIGCWEWDVCAGIVIVQEAGGAVVGSHEAFASWSSSSSFGDVTEEILMGKKYIVVRAVGDTSGFEAQKRIVREFYDTAEDVEVN